jgi:hypothetical protein
MVGSGSNQHWNPTRLGVPRRHRWIAKALDDGLRLGINPGGEVFVQEVPAMAEAHKNKLITDDALLLTLGSSGGKNTN